MLFSYITDSYTLSLSCQWKSEIIVTTENGTIVRTLAYPHLSLSSGHSTLISWLYCTLYRYYVNILIYFIQIENDSNFFKKYKHSSHYEQKNGFGKLMCYI